MNFENWNTNCIILHTSGQSPSYSSCCTIYLLHAHGLSWQRRELSCFTPPLGRHWINRFLSVEESAIPAVCTAALLLPSPLICLPFRLSPNHICRLVKGAGFSSTWLQPIVVVEKWGLELWCTIHAPMISFPGRRQFSIFFYFSTSSSQSGLLGWTSLINTYVILG